MSVSIVGWSHSTFGKLEEHTVESLIGQVAADALAHAGAAADDVDTILLGHFNSGFSEQDFSSSLVFQSLPSMRFTPSTRVENACATGSAAVHQGLTALEAKRANLVLVIGVEKMTHLPTRDVGRILLNACYREEEGAVAGGFAGVFGLIAQSYFQRYGDQSEALARIAAKNHANGVHNPYAQMRKDLGFEFCNAVSDKNPIVAGPLRRTDCSLISDGAAALVLARTEDALAFDRAITFRAATQVNDYLPMSKRDLTRYEGAEHAWAKAYEVAHIGVDDLDFAETHDCFTIAELMEYEAMGLAKAGQGAAVALEGQADLNGRLPVNPSGGLKSKGHPIGATGVSMHAMTCRQLLGEAGEVQVEDASLAGVFNMGGTAVANYVSILERIK